MKTVVITGVGRGIGLAAAEKFLSEGWCVIGTYNEHLPSIKHENFRNLQLDLRSSESILNVVGEILNLAEGVDVLVNNSGKIDAQKTGLDIQRAREIFEVNVFGLMDLTEKLISKIPTHGKIINVSSIYGAFSFPIDGPDYNAYRMSKAALNMYTRTLAYRLRDRGIIVAAFHPGWVKTDMGNSVADETDKPDREPREAAQDIYDLAIREIETGQFWQFGEKREW